jgi:hypothetical protein
LSYLLHIEDADEAYLNNLPLSDEAKRRVDDFIDYAIRNVDDHFRNDPANRPCGPGSPYFRCHLILRDRWR